MKIHLLTAEVCLRPSFAPPSLHKAFRLTQAKHFAPDTCTRLACGLALLLGLGATSAAFAQEAVLETVPEQTVTEQAGAEESSAQDVEYEENRVTDGVELLDGIQRSLDGPDVVITAGKDRTVYEYRQNGQLRLVKIVPSLGRPYYLVPADQTRGFGDLNQAEMLLPQWTIIEF